jgi:hypothetical protein
MAIADGKEPERKFHSIQVGYSTTGTFKECTRVDK